MKTTIALIILAAALAAPTFAHPGAHDDDTEFTREKSIPEKAQEAVLREITRAKLDPAWRTAKPGKPELRVAGNAKQWVVPFTAAAKAGAPKTLFVILTEAGEFVKASGSRR